MQKGGYRRSQITATSLPITMHRHICVYMCLCNMPHKLVNCFWRFVFASAQRVSCNNLRLSSILLQKATAVTVLYSNLGQLSVEVRNSKQVMSDTDDVIKFISLNVRLYAYVCELVYMAVALYHIVYAVDSLGFAI